MARRSPARESRSFWRLVNTDAHFQKIGKRPHHGICIPLFSLHTKKSCGIGEFLDLIPLIDWCKEVGFDVIQLLPLNDSGEDPSPYNAMSSFALDPIYLSLWELGIPCASENKQSPRVIRSEVLPSKEEKLWEWFLKKPEAPLVEFVKERPWVESYARFKALKKQNKGKSWQHWQELQAEADLVQFYIFLQYHAFRQMQSVKAYADKKGIFLKGDLPILISPDSADVWENPHLFNLHYSIGAPPDLYQPLGQKWGFPLIRWDAMQQERYKWWKMRLHSIENIYHIYRIDHAIGLFRFWIIPQGKKAADGMFFPKDPHLWEAHGEHLLTIMLQASPLLPMAEDLGTVPPVVRPTLKKLGICGTKVMRWETTAKGFIPLNQYEPLSMTTLGTHDLEPLGLWWKKYPTEAALFARFLKMDYQPLLSFEERVNILKASHATSSLFHINLLPEYLALFPALTALNPEEEQINHPGLQLSSNWTYRLRPSIEELASYPDLNTVIKEIIS